MNINKTLNESISKLNEQVGLYHSKIAYEKEKNKRRSLIYSKREKGLLNTIKEKQEEIKGFEEMRSQMKDMLEAKDKAIEQVYHQFEITKQRITEQLARSQRNEQQLENSYNELQKEVYGTKLKLKQFENKGQASQDILKVFQNLLASKELQIQKEKVKAQEAEFGEKQLMKNVLTLENELKGIKLAHEAEVQTWLRDTMESKFNNSF